MHEIFHVCPAILKLGELYACGELILLYHYKPDIQPDWYAQVVPYHFVKATYMPLCLCTNIHLQFLIPMTTLKLELIKSTRSTCS